MTSTLPRRPVDESAGEGRRSPRLKLWLATAVLAVLAIVAAWVLGFSSVLGARTVTVQGTHVLTADQVRAAARIAAGTPLIRLNQGQVTRRVEALPDVASAQVRLHYPHTVIISVTERVPIGYVSIGAGFALVDHTGRQFRTVTSAPATLPHFVLSGSQAQSVGAAMAAVAAALSGTPVLAQLSSISASDPEAITLTLRDGRTVLWGGAERSTDKARILPVLLGRDGHKFDISDPDQVVVN